MSNVTIIAQHNVLGGHWVAYFDGDACHAFGGDLPVRAIRRLLEGTDADPGTYELHCDAGLAGSHVLLRSIEWDPPELLFPCGHCEGRGEYVGLLEREVCPTCGGRKVVPV